MMRAICKVPGRLTLLDQSFSGHEQDQIETFDSAEKLLTVAQTYELIERLNGETIPGGEYTLEQAREDFETSGQVGHCYECDGEVVYRHPLFACSCTVLEANSEEIHPAWNLTIVTLRRVRSEAAAG
jgi:hypothetical protein